MKLQLLLLLCALAASSCKKGEPKALKCRPYTEAVADGTIPKKTVTLCLSDSLQYRLDYVRDQDGYRGKPFFCYGRLEMDSAAFSMAARKITGNYSPDRVIKIELLGEGKAICAGEAISLDDFTSCLVYYADRSNNACMDYIRLKEHRTEKHRVSNAYASLSIHYLFDKSNISNNPSIVSLVNKARRTGISEIKFIKREQDTVLKEAAASYQ